MSICEGQKYNYQILLTFTLKTALLKPEFNNVYGHSFNYKYTFNNCTQGQV